MKLCNEEFKNYSPFRANFEDVYIYKAGNLYYVCNHVQIKEITEWIYNGTKDEVNGWLYGCVQANNKIVEPREEILL